MVLSDDKIQWNNDIHLKWRSWNGSDIAFFTWLGNWFCLAKNAKYAYYVPESCTLLFDRNIVCKFSFYSTTSGLQCLPALLKTHESEDKEAEYKHIFVHIDTCMLILIKDLSLSLTPVAHRLSDRTGSPRTRNVWNFLVLKGPPVLHMTFRGQ